MYNRERDVRILLQYTYCKKKQSAGRAVDISKFTFVTRTTFFGCCALIFIHENNQETQKEKLFRNLKKMELKFDIVDFKMRPFAIL